MYPLAILAAVSTTMVAALTAAVSGVVAAVASVTNLRLAVARERVDLAVRAREWHTGSHGAEQYIEVVVTNIPGVRCRCRVSVSNYRKVNGSGARAADGRRATSPHGCKMPRQCRSHGCGRS